MILLIQIQGRLLPSENSKVICRIVWLLQMGLQYLAVLKLQYACPKLKPNFSKESWLLEIEGIASLCEQQSPSSLTHVMSSCNSIAFHEVYLQLKSVLCTTKRYTYSCTMHICLANEIENLMLWLHTGNQIGKDGCLALCRLLQDNQGITGFDLSGELASTKTSWDGQLDSCNIQKLIWLEYKPVAIVKA